MAQTQSLFAKKDDIEINGLVNCDSLESLDITKLMQELNNHSNDIECLENYGSMYYSQERKEKLKKIEDKTNIFLDMLKDDAFKVSLAQSIEKEFNTLGQQLLSENVKMKESKSLEEMKSFLLEGDMNDMETFRKLLNNANEEQKELIYSLNSHKLNNAINRKSEKEFPDYILETIAQPQAQPQNLYLKRYL